MIRYTTVAVLLAAALSLRPHAAPAAQIEATFLNASEAVFSRPHDVVIGPNGRLYVADLGNDRVAVLNPESLEVEQSLAEGELNSPHDVAFDGKGRLLVADTHNDRVAIYTLGETGAQLADELTEGLSAPEGVAIGPQGKIYVANARGHDIVVFEGNRATARTGERGDGPNAYKRPHDIDVDSSGRVIVADPGNHRLQVLSPDLAYESEIGGADYGFNEPKYFDLFYPEADPRGWLAVADEYNHQIKILDPERRILAVIGRGEVGEGPNLFNYPEGVELKADIMWVADTRNHRIVRYRLTGLPGPAK